MVLTKKMKMGIVVGVLFITVLFCLSVYNGLVDKQENARMAWSQVENVTQRRMDLIPNYVEVVKAYAKHEKELLVAVTEARSKAGQTNISADDLNNMDPEKFKQYQAAQSQLTGALSRLMVVVEKYPELKSNENFLKLQDELAGSENRISTERRRYNKAVTEYNKALRRISGKLFAGVGDFNRMPLFKADEAAKTVPKVKFD